MKYDRRDILDRPYKLIVLPASSLSCLCSSQLFMRSIMSVITHDSFLLIDH